MGDDTEKQRPNANYELSPDTVRPEEIVYHYNRERRLAKAPQAVQDMYKEQPRRRFGGLFNSLLGSTPRKMLFGTIVILCLLIWALSALDLLSDSHELEGNILSVHGERLEETIIITVRKLHKRDAFSRRNRAYTGPVDIAVVPAARTIYEQTEFLTGIFFHRIFFTYEPMENYRFVVPFDHDELVLVFQTEKSTLTMTIKPE